MELLENFISENEIEVGGKSLFLCLKGIAKMENNLDPLHSHNHPLRMIKDALVLAKVEKITVDWPILLTAICWHDVWTAKNVPKNIFGFAWEFFWDGMGSARMFGREAKKDELEKGVTERIKKVIRKHPSIHLGKHETAEEKILFDIDNLETWSWERVRPLEKELIREKRGRRERRQIRLAKFYFDHFMKNRDGKNLYFDWSRTEFRKRKELYLRKTERLMKKYGVE